MKPVHKALRCHVSLRGDLVLSVCKFSVVSDGLICSDSSGCCELTFANAVDTQSKCVWHCVHVHDCHRAAVCAGDQCWAVTGYFSQ